jgi:hypothetical protein
LLISFMYISTSCFYPLIINMNKSAV